MADCLVFSRNTGSGPCPGGVLRSGLSWTDRSRTGHWLSLHLLPQLPQAESQPLSALPLKHSSVSSLLVASTEPKPGDLPRHVQRAFSLTDDSLGLETQVWSHHGEVMLTPECASPPEEGWDRVCSWDLRSRR